MTTDILQSLIYSNYNGGTPTLAVLDQLLIPAEQVYIDVPDVETAWDVIHATQIRGDPLIAIVALLGLAVDLYSNPATIDKLKHMDESQVFPFIREKMEYLKTSSPTTVNLTSAMHELHQLVAEASYRQMGEKHTYKELLLKSVLDYAESMLTQDVSDNHASATSTLFTPSATTTSATQVVVIL